MASYLAEGLIFKMAASHFVDISEEEINLMKENTIITTKFGITFFKGKMRKFC